MMVLRFSLRQDMPPGFEYNPTYGELPATVSFLEELEYMQFHTKKEFEEELEKFPEYLKDHKIPKSSDKALRAGLFLEEVKTEGIEELLNVYTKSDENSSGRCWFGSFGPQKSIEKYFDLQSQARQRSIEDDDDCP